MTAEHMPQGSNMFKSDADALICPVNCVGTLGAGLARVFAAKYPDMVQPYEYACGIERIAIGRVFTIDLGDVDIVCVPTKNHWRNDSILEDVLKAIEALVVEAERQKWRVMSVPALGCGLGNLEWEPVKEALYESFRGHTTHARIFPPGPG